MNAQRIDTHLGVRFKVEALPCKESFEGRFTLLQGENEGQSGVNDSYRPSVGPTWATVNEALDFATQAAHHAIEGIQPFTREQSENAP
jgi:hypothetical protein